MALSSKAANFAINTSTGNQAVTGVGFQPKIVLFFPTINTADGINVHAHASIGAGISSTERFSLTANSEHSVGTSDTTREDSAALCIQVNAEGTGTAKYEADLVSLDADGFTINVTTAPGSAFRVGYLAIGGDDLTNVDISNFALNTSTGNQSVTGLGFQPDAMIFISKTENSIGSQSNFHFMLGFAVSSTKRGVMDLASQNGQATSNTNRYQIIDKCISGLSSGGGLTMEADFVSFDADGFTIDITNAGGTADIVHWIAFKGGQYDVGSFNSQTSSGNFSKTGVGFTPTNLILTSFLNATAGTVQTGNEFSLGVASSSTERFSAGENDEDGQASTESNSYSDDGKIYLNYNFGQTKNGDIDFVSFDGDGFTLNQTDADPSANEILYMTMGSTGVAVAANKGLSGGFGLQLNGGLQ